MNEALPAGGSLRNTLLWPSALFLDGREQGQLLQPVQLVTTVTTTVASSDLGKGTGDGTQSLFRYGKSWSHIPGELT